MTQLNRLIGVCDEERKVWIPFGIRKEANVGLKDAKTIVRKLVQSYVNYTKNFKVKKVVRHGNFICPDGYAVGNVELLSELGFVTNSDTNAKEGVAV